MDYTGIIIIIILLIDLAKTFGISFKLQDVPYYDKVVYSLYFVRQTGKYSMEKEKVVKEEDVEYESTSLFPEYKRTLLFTYTKKINPNDPF